MSLQSRDDYERLQELLQSHYNSLNTVDMQDASSLDTKGGLKLPLATEKKQQTPYSGFLEQI